jgi:hypothetical protein
VFLLFLALLPQFTDPQASWPVWLQILLLGLVPGSSLVVYLMVGYGAKAVLRTRPVAAQVVGRVSGQVMIGDCAGVDCRADALNSARPCVGAALCREGLRSSPGSQRRCINRRGCSAAFS